MRAAASDAAYMCTGIQCHTCRERTVVSAAHPRHHTSRHQIQREREIQRTSCLARTESGCYRTTSHAPSYPMPTKKRCLKQRAKQGVPCVGTKS